MRHMHGDDVSGALQCPAHAQCFLIAVKQPTKQHALDMRRPSWSCQHSVRTAKDACLIAANDSLHLRACIDYHDQLTAATVRSN
eukprot:6102-Heterococcus_DN1.PRE.2